MFIENDLWWLLRRAANDPREPWREHPAAKLFRNLVHKEDFGVVDFDITALDGVNANNDDWGHLSDFAFRNFRHDYDGGCAIRFATDADFEINKQIFAEAILNPTAHVSWCEWSGRSYLRNSGRGHHTAAIYRQCLADGRAFKFPASVEARRVDLQTIQKLSDYWLVVCDSRTALWITSMVLDYEKPDRRWEDNWISLDLDRTRWFDCPNSPTILFARRGSLLFTTAEQWLRGSPNLFWDLSTWLNAYIPVPRNDPRLLFCSAAPRP